MRRNRNKNPRRTRLLKKRPSRIGLRRRGWRKRNLFRIRKITIRRRRCEQEQWLKILTKKKNRRKESKKKRKRRIQKRRNRNKRRLRKLKRDKKRQNRNKNYRNKEDRNYNK